MTPFIVLMKHQPFFRATGGIILLQTFAVLLQSCTRDDDWEGNAGKSICIEDFDSFKETGYQKTSFAAMMQQQTGNEQCGWLYAVMDSNSSMNPSIAYSGAPMERGITAGRDGNCFHAVFTIRNNGWFAFGCDLLDTGKGYDLSGFDKITFDARGSGRIMAELRSGVEKRRGSNFWCPMLSEPVTLTDEWKTVSMDRESFSFYSDKLSAEGVTPKQFLGEVTNLQFRNTIPAQAANETVDLWIDNIRLWGVTQEVFYP